MKTKISLFLVAFLTVTLAFSQEKKWTLKECVTHALENNLSVKRTKYTTDLRKEDIQSTRGNMLPGLSASASHSYSWGSGINPITGTRVANTRSNNFNVGTSVAIFNGFSLKNSLKQSKASYEASLLDLEKMKNDISLNIVNSYLNVLFNKENLKIAESQLEISKKQYEQTKALVDQGVQPKGNLLEVEATKINDENAIVTAENNVSLALLTLSQLLQIPNQGFDIEDFPININSVALLYNNTNEVFEKAVANQPEIKSAEISLSNAETGIKIAKASYLPSLSMNAGLGSGYNHVQGKPDILPVFDKDGNPVLDVNGKPTFKSNGFREQLDNNFGQSLGFSLTIPIFNRGQVKANVNRAKINKEIATINLSDQKRALREAIERAYINAKATLKEYEAAKKSVEAQELSFKYAQERYNLGATNSFDFEQVRNRFVNAKANLTRAKYNFVFRTKVLEFYYGIPIVTE